MANNLKCAILVPVARTLEDETREALCVLEQRGYVVKLLCGGSQVDLVRSAMASDALRAGFDETIWIDSDIAFQADWVEKLREHDLPFVAGLYVKKGRDEFACKFLEGTSRVSFGARGRLVEIESVGFGFCRVKAWLYRKIAEHFKLPVCTGGYDPDKAVTPYFLPMVVPSGKQFQYLGEDTSFCYRARAVGVKILADTRFKLGHLHRKARTWDDLSAQPVYDGLDIDFKAT